VTDEKLREMAQEWLALPIDPDCLMDDEEFQRVKVAGLSALLQRVRDEARAERDREWAEMLDPKNKLTDYGRFFAHPERARLLWREKVDLACGERDAEWIKQVERSARIWDATPCEQSTSELVSSEILKRMGVPRG